MFPGKAGIGWHKTSWRGKQTWKPNRAAGAQGKGGAPDGGQVEPACSGGRGQQQRGLVVAEGVQRLDGLRALRQQHCGRARGTRQRIVSGARPRHDCKEGLASCMLQGASWALDEIDCAVGGQRATSEVCEVDSCGHAKAAHPRSCGRPRARCAAAPPARAPAPRRRQTP
jgi:hypothetical protein